MTDTKFEKEFRAQQDRNLALERRIKDIVEIKVLPPKRWWQFWKKGND